MPYASAPRHARFIRIASSARDDRIIVNDRAIVLIRVNGAADRARTRPDER
jgi:hypothetical protein